MTKPVWSHVLALSAWTLNKAQVKSVTRKQAILVTNCIQRNILASLETSTLMNGYARTCQQLFRQNILTDLPSGKNLTYL